MTNSTSQPFCTCPFEKTPADRWETAGSRTQPGLHGIGPGETVTKQNGSDRLILRHLLLWVPKQHTSSGYCTASARMQSTMPGSFLNSDDPIVALFCLHLDKL